jgi:hypothetical protein
MSILNSKEWKLIKGILGDIDYAIAGGYARDSFFGRKTFLGRKPKDMDVGVFCLDAVEIVEVLSTLESSDCIIESFFDEEELIIAHYKGNHIAGIIKCIGDIDIIFCNEEVQNAQDWINTFDYNLNKFLLTEISSVREDLDTLGISTFRGEDFGVLKFYNTNTNRVGNAIKRQDKMLKLSQEIGWKVPQEILDMDVKEEVQRYSLLSST